MGQSSSELAIIGEVEFAMTVTWGAFDYGVEKSPAGSEVVYFTMPPSATEEEIRLVAEELRHEECDLPDPEFTELKSIHRIGKTVHNRETGEFDYLGSRILVWQLRADRC